MSAALFGPARSFGVALTGPDAARRGASWARSAEDAGLDSLWIVEDYFQHGAFALAGALAAATTRIGIGLGVVNPSTRHPAVVAMETATLAGLAPGRVVLGLGTGVRHWVAAQMGLPFETPLATLRQAIDAIRRLWRGERVTIEGPAFSLREVALEYAPIDPAPPIALGVKGPKALALAGEIGDGIVCSILSSPPHVERVRATTRRRDVPVLAYVPIAVSRDRYEARRSVRPLLARYLAHLHGQSILADAGVGTSVTSALRTARTRGEEGSALVTDGLLDTFAIAGTPDDCRKALARWACSGLTAPIAVIPPGLDVPEQLAHLGAELAPFWRTC